MAGNPILMLLEGNGSLAGRDRDGAFSATGSGALRYAPAEGSRINYAVNGGGESATNFGFFWSSSSGSSVSRVAGGSEGDWSVRIQNDGLTPYSGSSISTNRTTGFPVNRMAGRQMWARFKWKGTGLVSVYLQAYWDDYSAAETVIGGQIVAPPADWEELVVGPVVCPARMADIRVLFGIDDLADGSRAFDIQVDEVMFTEADPTDWPYFAEHTAGTVVVDWNTDQVTTAYAGGAITYERAVFWVEEGTTNLILNPSAEVNVDSSVASGASSVVTRDTTGAVFGGACYKMVTGGVDPGEYVFMPTHAALGLTGSARAFAGQAWLRGSGQVWLRSSVLYTDTSIANSVDTVVDLSDEWQHIECEILTVNGAKTIDFLWIIVQMTGTQAGTVYIDGVQLEEKAYATSYCDGSLGTGYSWVGTAHLSGSTRAASYITHSAAGRFDVDQGAAAVRVFNSYGIGDGNRWVWHHGIYGSEDFIGVNIANNTATLQAKAGAGADESAGSPVVSEAQWRLLGAGWTLGNLEMAVLGVGNASGVRTESPVGGAQGLEYGSYGGSQQADVLLGPVAIYDRLLTDAELVRVGSVIEADTDLWNLLGLDEEELAGRQYLMLAPFAEDSFE